MTQSLDKVQLRKLLLVALSSDQPGEVMAALGKVKAVLERADLDVHWLADAIAVTPATPLNVVWEPTVAPTIDWREQLEFLTTKPERDLMSFREAEFIESVMLQWATRTEWKPTYKQQRWLRDIYARLSTQRR